MYSYLKDENQFNNALVYFVAKHRESQKNKHRNCWNWFCPGEPKPTKMKINEDVLNYLTEMKFSQPLSAFYIFKALEHIDKNSLQPDVIFQISKYQDDINNLLECAENNKKLKAQSRIKYISYFLAESFTSKKRSELLESMNPDMPSKGNESEATLGSIIPREADESESIKNLINDTHAIDLYADKIIKKTFNVSGFNFTT